MIAEIEILAWEIMGLEPPPELLAKKKAGTQPVVTEVVKEKGGKGWLLWTTVGLAGAGAAAYYYLSAEQPQPLPEPPALP